MPNPLKGRPITRDELDYILTVLDAAGADSWIPKNEFAGYNVDDDEDQDFLTLRTTDGTHEIAVGPYIEGGRGTDDDYGDSPELRRPDDVTEAIYVWLSQAPTMVRRLVAHAQQTLEE